MNYTVSVTRLSCAVSVQEINVAITYCGSAMRGCDELMMSNDATVGWCGYTRFGWV